MTQPDPAQQQIHIELPGALEPVYSNFAIINHSPSEIVVDFAPAARRTECAHKARVVMTPLNTKLLLQALQDNLAKYEERFGAISLPSDLGFQAPPGLFEGRKPGA